MPVKITPGGPQKPASDKPADGKSYRLGIDPIPANVSGQVDSRVQQPVAMPAVTEPTIQEQKDLAEDESEDK